MKSLKLKNMRAVINQYAIPNNQLAISIFLADLGLYIFAIYGVIMFDNLALRIILAVFSGLKIGTLFLVSHDSAHDSFTSSRKLNRIIGRIAFLPSFHNYSLWLIAHNRAHHLSPNVKGQNSWSPLSKSEFDAFPAWRKSLEKLYRCPIGISFNYMIERWWKDKFYPYKRIVKTGKLIHFLDFILVSAYMSGFISFLIFMGLKLPHTSPVELLILAFVIPLFVSNFLIGSTIYQHHTHESIPWFETIEESKYYVGQEDITMNVIYPDWYNFISNNAMIHTVHHIDPRVPLYNTTKAQAVLYKEFSDKMISKNFSFSGFISTMSKCKLYDYENHCWLDFSGCPTTETTLCLDKVELADAA